MKRLDGFILLSAISLIALLFVGLTVIGDTPVSTEQDITIEYLTDGIQRKRNHQTEWLSFNKNDVLYNLDQLKTDTLARIRLQLKNSTIIEVQPESNVIIQTEPSVSINVNIGSVNIDLTQCRSLCTLTFTGQTRHYNVSKGTVQFLVNSHGHEISTDHEAVVHDIDNNTNMNENQTSEIRQDHTHTFHHSIEPLQPTPNSHLFIDKEKQKIEVLFSWPGNAATLMIAKENSTDHTITLKNQISPVTVPLTTGHYTWQIFRQHQKSAKQQLTIRSVQPTQLQKPTPNQTIHTEQIITPVYFQWQNDNLSSSYFFEIAHDRSFTERIYFTLLQRNNLTLPLTASRYYWRVLGRSGLAGAEYESEAATFEIIGPTTSNPQIRNSDTAEPTASLHTETDSLNLISPIGVISLDQKQPLLFRWRGGEHGKQTFKLKDATGTVLIERNVNDQSFTLYDTGQLDTGIFRWSIQTENESAEAKFTIIE